MLNCVSLKTSKDLIKENYSFLNTEIINICDSINRIIAIDVYSDSNYPSFNRSTVDGYAVVASKTYGSSQAVPVIFKCVNDINIGVYDNNNYSNDDCIYVPTGGMVKEPFNAVVMIENTKRDNDDVLVFSKVTNNENIIQIGEDIKEKELVISKGTLITTKYIGLLASLGISKVKVYKKFNYSIISTGDEIIPIDEQLSNAYIRDINSYTIDSMIKPFGKLINKYLVKDDYKKLEEIITKSFNESDIVFISGGSSVGNKDYTLRIIDSICDKVLFHGISIKPGKPTMAGVKDNKLIIGLPGHPMAAIMSLSLIFIDSIKEVYNDNSINYVYAKTSINFPSNSGKTTIMPIKLETINGELLATPIFYKSGLINILSKADGFTVIDEKVEGINKSELIKVRLL